MLMCVDFNEYFSDFNSVRHNDWFTIFLFYGVMKYVLDCRTHLSNPLANYSPAGSGSSSPRT